MRNQSINNQYQRPVNHNSGMAAPSAWVRRYATTIVAGGSVLDLACGSGRHSLFFCELGYRVTAVDLDIGPIESANGHRVDSGLPLEIICADLETDTWPLSDRTFDAIVVTNYLYRPHFPLLATTLAPGGVLLFATFAVGNERFGRPSNPAFLLNPGELLEAFAGNLRIVAYEHGEFATPRPAVRQRLCAFKPDWPGKAACNP